MASRPALGTVRRGRALWVIAVVGALAVGGCGTRVDRAAYYARLSESGTSAAGEPVDGGTSETDAPISGGIVAGPASGEPGSGGVGSHSAGSGSRSPSPTGAARPGGKGATTTTRGPRGPAGTLTAGGPAAPGGAAPAGAAAAAGPDRSGLSTDPVGDVVRIGLHVPETGAAPMPTDWKDVLNVVEDHVNTTPVHGRKIHFVVEDDGYDASRGLAACRKLADENVLFVIGHTAPAAEDACAGLYQSRRIPYLMRGVMEKVLSGRSLAWFGTIADDVQGRLLADYALNRLGARTKKSAVVYENDQTSARDSFVGRLREAGATVTAEEVNGRQSDFSAVVQKLQQAGAELVFLSLPPVGAIKIAVQSQGQGYHPTWLGGASYWNYNMALESAGAAMDGAISFSPWPSVDSADAAEYRAAYSRARPGKEASDIGLVMWGWGNLARAALERAGPALSRASFAAALDGFEFRPPYWNPVRYAAGDHSGTASVAVFRADGQARRWRQISGFSDRF
ncbi:MAG TPA: ABC transporter substrate-binding protein [Acidimicrobiales bacterium]|nr:ABC transporter substrate-binding protein [Acidimicrobiales bacterium]